MSALGQKQTFRSAIILRFTLKSGYSACLNYPSAGDVDSPSAKQQRTEN